MARRLLLTAAVLFLLIPTMLFAQDNATVEFYGTIQSANATALVVNGLIVDTSGAQVETPLVVGMTVHVTAAYAEDGSLTAQSVEAVSPGTIPGVVAISGEITDITPNAIRIRGHLIVMDKAVISGTLHFGSGASATVYAVESAPDVWDALVVVAGEGIPAAPPQVAALPETSTPNATPEVSAPVATPEVVSTAEVSTPIATPEVSAPVATPEVGAPAATPEVGAPAATPEVGAPAATQEVGNDSSSQSETFVIEGTLTAIGSKTILVDGKRYDISTARRDGTLVVGARVRLELQVLNGQAVLIEIKVIDAGSDDNSGSGGSSGGSGSSNSGSGSDDGSSGKGGSDG